MQNFPVAGVMAPQFGQRNSIGMAHLMQNFASSGFSKRHLGHFIFHISLRFKDDLTAQKTTKAYTQKYVKELVKAKSSIYSNNLFISG
jgi:hypothetical protein